MKVIEQDKGYQRYILPINIWGMFSLKMFLSCLDFTSYQQDLPLGLPTARPWVTSAGQQTPAISILNLYICYAETYACIETYLHMYVHTLVYACACMCPSSVHDTIAIIIIVLILHYTSIIYVYTYAYVSTGNNNTCIV